MALVNENQNHHLYINRTLKITPKLKIFLEVLSKHFIQHSHISKADGVLSPCQAVGVDTQVNARTRQRRIFKLIPLV